jgi:hypothetical protein
MSRYGRIAYLSLRNRLFEESRYPLQFVLNYLFFATLGYFLALGGVAVQGGGNVLGNVASFFLAFMAGGALNLPAELLANNKTRLEEFYLRPLPSIPYFAAVSLGRMVETVITMSLMIAVIGVFRGDDLNVLLRFLTVAIPVFIAMMGLGLGLAGLRLMYQKIGVLPQILWVVMLGTALAASTSSLQKMASWSVFSNALLYLRGNPLNDAVFLVAALATLAMGIAAFLFCERLMFQRGLISQE